MSEIDHARAQHLAEVIEHHLSAASRNCTAPTPAAQVLRR